MMSDLRKDALTAVRALREWVQAVPDDTPLPAPVGERAQFNAAIDFAIKQGIEAGVFLDAWRHGDTSEWPEFQPPQTQQPVQNTKAEGGAA